jgi:hypothetical protein
MSEKKVVKNYSEPARNAENQVCKSISTKNKGEKARILLSKTEAFPPCRTCGSVKWVLVMAA